MTKNRKSNMWSYWEKVSFVNKVDVAIVGSGIVGLNAAVEIKRRSPHMSVLVLEAGPLPSGASTKNAGFACFGSPTELLMDLKSSPPEVVFGLLEKRLRGLELLRQIVGDVQLGYESPGSYELFLEGDNSFESVQDNLGFLNAECEKLIGFRPYSMHPDIVTQNGFHGFAQAVQIKGEGQIDTGKMMRSLIEIARQHNVQFLNGIRVERYESHGNTVLLDTKEGRIECDKCLIATNGFAKQLIKKTVEPARAQVLITSEIDNLPFAGTYHFDSGYYYFRNVGKRVLFGGGRNLDFETENSSINELNDSIQTHLNQILKDQILPQYDYTIAHQWTGIMGVGEHKSPYVEKLEEGVYCAVKLGGMGIAIGSSTGIEAANLLLNS